MWTLNFIDIKSSDIYMQDILHETSNNNNEYKILLKLRYTCVYDINYNSFANSLTNLQTFVSNCT